MISWPHSSVVQPPPGTTSQKNMCSAGINGLFNVTAFIFVGAWMPFGDFHINGGLGMGLEVWRLVVLAVLIFLSRRLLIMMGLYRWILELKTWKEAVFFGHFGPMGITTIFLSTLPVVARDGASLSNGLCHDEL